MASKVKIILKTSLLNPSIDLKNDSETKNVNRIIKIVLNKYIHLEFFLPIKTTKLILPVFLSDV